VTQWANKERSTKRPFNRPLSFFISLDGVICAHFNITQRSAAREGNASDRKQCHMKLSNTCWINQRMGRVACRVADSVRYALSNRHTCLCCPREMNIH
jgi:hypothetical protein